MLFCSLFRLLFQRWGCERETRNKARKTSPGRWSHQELCRLAPVNLRVALVLLRCLYPQQPKDVALQKSLHSQYQESAAGFSSSALQAKKISSLSSLQL